MTDKKKPPKRLLPAYTFYPRTLRRGVTYYVQFSYKGVQRAFNCQTGNKEDAKAKAEELIGAYMDKVDAGLQAGSNQNLDVVVREFLDAQYPDKPETRSKIAQRIRVLQEALGTNKTADISEPLMRKTYHKIMKVRKYQKHYWADLITAWKKCFKFLKKMKYVSNEDFFEYIVAPKTSTFRKFEEVISDEDFDKLLPLFTKEDQNYLMVMRYSSMYQSDIYGLMRKHFKEDPRPGNKTGWLLVKARQKGKSVDEEHEQPMHTKLVDILVPRIKACENGDDKIFPEITETTFKKFGQNLWSRWNWRFKKAFPGRKPLKLTVTRHSFITSAIDRKVHPSTLRRWIGHSPRSKALERYNHHDGHLEDMG
jgi:hypothetical protein